jgi:hypothetical protein
MTATQQVQGRRVRAPHGWDRPMLVLAAAMVLWALVAGVGLAVDDRLVVGAPAWAKPLKFALSIALYAVTWSWLISLLTGRARRAASWISIVLVLALMVEVVGITIQVVRGTRSHFNMATTFDTTLFFLMGQSIAVLWMLTLVLAILLLRAPVADSSVRHAIRWGTAIALVGMALAFLMTMPTAQQAAAADAGATLDVIGGHTVGAADGGAGLPLLGWSTQHGDLRVGHFVGMHALQALPLLALGLQRLAPRLPRLDERARTGLVTTAAVGWLLLTALVTWQALRGQSVLAPDATTLTAGLALVGVLALGVRLSLRRVSLAPRTRST